MSENLPEPFKNNPLSTFFQWVQKNQLYIYSLLLGLVAGVMFLIVIFADYFYSLNIQSGDEVFSVRISTIILFLVYVFGTYTICFLRGWNIWRALSVWLQSNILMLLSLAFIFRLNNTPLNLLGISISTGMVFVPLMLLIVFVNINLFGKNKPSFFLTTVQVLLFFVQAFSLINFLADNKVTILAFREPILEYIFNLNVYVWLAVCAFAVTVVSIFNLKILGIKHRILASMVFFVLIFQALFVVNSLNLGSYWYKTLMMLVFWDFIYNPYKTVLEKRIDPHFKTKLSISIFYHILLLILIVLWYFFGFGVINPS